MNFSMILIKRIIMLKNMICILASTILLYACTIVPHSYQQYYNTQRVFARNHMACEIKPGLIGLQNTSTYIVNPPIDRECAGLAEMPSFQAYYHNTKYWNDRRGYLRSRVLGIVPKGTLYHIRDIDAFRGSFYYYSIVIDSGPMKGTHAELTAAGPPNF
ncbi:MAG: hypothetical protein ABI597_00605 [Gammaproteobacteria bacterium]